MENPVGVPIRRGLFSETGQWVHRNVERYIVKVVYPTREPWDECSTGQDNVWEVDYKVGLVQKKICYAMLTFEHSRLLCRVPT
jgi:hypothetical protein